MKNITVNFGGFYYSIHDELIDGMIESYYDGNDYSGLDINYQEIFQAYSKRYLSVFSEWLLHEFNLDASFKYVELYSPREYNFSTDKIIATITNASHKALYNKFKRNESFLDYLKDATQSKSGYVSFYSYDEALQDKDNIFTDYLTSYLCALFNESEFLNYYDRKNMYELIYGIDLPMLECEVQA